jgi:hypothetical protein
MHQRLNPALSAAWIGLAAVTVLLQGCAQRGWNGVFAVDLAGGARTCVAPAASSPVDGTAVAAQVQMSSEGGWCGVTLNRGGAPLDSYLIVTRPAHGHVFAHRVGSNTRIDYTPDVGFQGTDSFAVRMIPGNAVLQVSAVVTR